MLLLIRKRQQAYRVRNPWIIDKVLTVIGIEFKFTDKNGQSYMQNISYLSGIPSRSTGETATFRYSQRPFWAYLTR